MNFITFNILLILYFILIRILEKILSFLLYFILPISFTLVYFDYINFDYFNDTNHIRHQFIKFVDDNQIINKLDLMYYTLLNYL